MRGRLLQLGDQAETIRLRFLPSAPAGEGDVRRRPDLRDSGNLKSLGAELQV